MGVSSDSSVIVCIFNLVPIEEASTRVEEEKTTRIGCHCINAPPCQLPVIPVDNVLLGKVLPSYEFCDRSKGFRVMG